MEYPSFKVCVRCFTYNQSKYITSTLDGFCIQNTDFPYVCCIVDDASTDGEQEVINNYLKAHFNLFDSEVAYKKETEYAYITFAQHNKNKNCYAAILFLKKNHYSTPKLSNKKLDYLVEWRNLCKYEAICEGDDYWILPSKLQKQVSFLDEHQDYVLVHSDFIALNDVSGQRICHASSKYDIFEGDIFEKLFERCFIRTATVCHRLIPLELNINMLPPDTFGGDLFLFYNLTSKGKAHFMKEETCVYRILPESASHTNSELMRRKMNLKYKNLDYFVANYYNLPSIISMLDRKWFKIDLRNCIVSKDYDGLDSLKIPKGEVSIAYKILYYCCRSKLFMACFNALLMQRRKLMPLKWF